MKRKKERGREGNEKGGWGDLVGKTRRKKGKTKGGRERISDVEKMEELDMDWGDLILVC